MTDVLKWGCSDVYTTVNALKSDELYTVNEWRAWFVNYISIDLLKGQLGQDGW